MSFGYVLQNTELGELFTPLTPSRSVSSSGTQCVDPPSRLHLCGCRLRSCVRILIILPVPRRPSSTGRLTPDGRPPRKVKMVGLSQLSFQVGPYDGFLVVWRTTLGYLKRRVHGTWSLHSTKKKKTPANIPSVNDPPNFLFVLHRSRRLRLVSWRPSSRFFSFEKKKKKVLLPFCFGSVSVVISL